MIIVVLFEYFLFRIQKYLQRLMFLKLRLNILKIRPLLCASELLQASLLEFSRASVSSRLLSVGEN